MTRSIICFVSPPRNSFHKNQDENDNKYGFFHIILRVIPERTPDKLLFRAVEEKCKQPHSKQSHNIPDDKTGDKSAKRQDIRAETSFGMQSIQHKGFPDRWEQENAEITHGIHDAYPISGNFQKMICVDHKKYFNKLIFYAIYSLQQSTSFITISSIFPKKVLSFFVFSPTFTNFNLTAQNKL